MRSVAKPNSGIKVDFPPGSGDLTLAIVPNVPERSPTSPNDPQDNSIAGNSFDDGVSAIIRAEKSRPVKDGPGKRLWRFIFAVRRLPQFDGLRDFAHRIDALNLASGALDRLLRRDGTATADDPWLHFFGVESTEATATFEERWPQIRSQPGEVLDAARDLARKVLFHPNDQEIEEERAILSKSDREKSYIFFLSVIGHLQAIVGDADIMIPNRKFATLLGVSRATVGIWTRKARRQGYLELTAAHEFRGEGSDVRSDAAKYRFRRRMFKAIEGNGGIAHYKSIRPRSNGNPDDIIERIPLADGSELPITERFIVDLRVQFPNVDVRRELPNAMEKLRGRRPPKNEAAAERFLSDWMHLAERSRWKKPTNSAKRS